MGRGRRSEQLTGRVDAGEHTDYKDDGLSTWSEVKQSQTENPAVANNQLRQRKSSSGEELDEDNLHLPNAIHRDVPPAEDALDCLNIRSVAQHNCDPTTSGFSSEYLKGAGQKTRLSSSTFWMSISVTVVVTTFILLTSNVGLVSSCNEAVCASIVSKCTLTRSCACELANCSCCRECFDCLNYLYDECCSCVELCPKPNVSHHVTTHSQVGDLKEPIDELFKALTEEKDIQGRWATFTFPIDIDQSWFMPKPEAASSANVYTVANGKIIVDPTKEVVTVNCTVAYMSECMPLNKCRNSCHSMGASYFRWFHDGCCECIGSTCINYGIDESRCSRCSMEDDAEDDPVDSADIPDETDNDTGKDT